MTPKTRVTPCTTGKSRLKIDWIIRLPMPGMAKTFSTISVPPIRKPMLMPSTVTAGMTALRSTCRTNSRRPGTPLDRAVVM